MAWKLISTNVDGTTIEVDTSNTQLRIKDNGITKVKLNTNLFSSVIDDTSTDDTIATSKTIAQAIKDSKRGFKFTGYVSSSAPTGVTLKADELWYQSTITEMPATSTFDVYRYDGTSWSTSTEAYTASQLDLWANLNSSAGFYYFGTWNRLDFNVSVDNTTIDYNLSNQLEVKDGGLTKAKTSAEFWTDNALTGTTTAENLTISNTFSSDKLSATTEATVPTPTADMHAATKKYVDDVDKTKIDKFSTMPSTGLGTTYPEGLIVEFVGTDASGTYTNGYFYKVVADTSAAAGYSWKREDVQPNYKLVHTLDTVTIGSGSKDIWYYLDTPYVTVSGTSYAVGAYIYDGTDFVPVSSASTTGNILVATVDETTTTLPTLRPDSTSLVLGDYVKPSNSATFPFTVEGLTFTSVRDSAVYMSNGNWALNASPYQNTGETPVVDKTTESIDGSSSTAAYQKDINIENVSAINASASQATFTKPDIGEVNLTIKDRKNNEIINQTISNVVFTSDAQTLTNKTIDADSNTISNLEVDNLKAGVLDTTDLTSTDDTHVASSKLIQAKLDEKVDHYVTLPTASASIEGKIVQYIGATTTTAPIYKNACFYKCEEITPSTTPATYQWVQVSVSASSTGDIVVTDKTTESINGSSSTAAYQKDINIENVAALKGRIEIVDTMPTASAELEGRVYILNGNPGSEDYKKGGIYACTEDIFNPGTYIFKEINGIVDFKEVTNLPIIDDADANTIYYLSDNENDNPKGLYTYHDGSGTFVLMANLSNVSTESTSLSVFGQATTGINVVNIGYNSNSIADNTVVIGAEAEANLQGNVAIGYSAKAESPYTIQIGEGTNSTANTLQVKDYTLLNTDNGLIPYERLADKLDYFPAPEISIADGKIYQYTGGTSAELTHGHFYECVESTTTPGTYIWQEIEFGSTDIFTMTATPTSSTEGTIDKTDTQIRAAISKGQKLVVKVPHTSDPTTYYYYVTDIADDGSTIKFLATIANPDLASGTKVSILDWNNGSNTYIIETIENGLKFQYDTLPTASVDLIGKVYQFTGTTTTTAPIYIHNQWYECKINTSGTYEWVAAENVFIDVDAWTTDSNYDQIIQRKKESTAIDIYALTADKVALGWTITSAGINNGTTAITYATIATDWDTTYNTWFESNATGTMVRYFDISTAQNLATYIYSYTEQYFYKCKFAKGSILYDLADNFIEVSTLTGVTGRVNTLYYLNQTSGSYDKGLYKFDKNACDFVSVSATIKVDDTTIELNSSGQLQVKDAGITPAKLETQTAADEGKGLLVKADGTWEVNNITQYKQISSLSTETGNTYTYYYLDTAEIIGITSYEVGCYTWNSTTGFTLVANVGDGGGGGTGTTPTFVGTVTNGDSFPTSRPNGDLLVFGDYVKPDSSSTFPFTIGTVTFTTENDTAVYSSGTNWLLNASAYQKTNQTPVVNKTLESINASSSSAVYQSDINTENAAAINARLEQFTTMPAASVSFANNKSYQYIGVTTTTEPIYTHGYFYECQMVLPATEPITYEWVQVSVGAGSGVTSYEDLTDKPQINSNELEGDKDSYALDILWSGTKAEYDALTDKTAYTIYCTTDEGVVPTTSYYSRAEIDALLLSKQSISDSTLQTVHRTVPTAINELYSDVRALSGVVQIKVVTALPASPENNTIYYVGTASPYQVKLYTSAAGYTDLGSTEIDLSDYQTKAVTITGYTATTVEGILAELLTLLDNKVNVSDIVNSVSSTEATKPLSANMGYYLMNQINTKQSKITISSGSPSGGSDGDVWFQI